MLLPLAAPSQDADTLFLEGFEAWRAGDLQAARDKFSTGLLLREDPTARDYLNRIDGELAAMPMPELRGRWRSETSGDCQSRYSEFDLDGLELVVTLFEGTEITRWVSYTILKSDGREMILRFDRIEPPMPVFEAAYGMELQVTAEGDHFIWRRADGDESHIRCP